MKRKVKNIINIALIIIVCGAAVFTIIYAKNNLINESNEFESGQMIVTPPENNNDSDLEMPEASDSDENVPEKPTGSDSVPEKPSEDSNMPDNFVTSENANSLTTIYYVFLGVESLLFSVLVLYLFMSKFNEKSIKETFSVTDKIIIYVLSVIIITCGLTYGISYITNNYILSSNTNKNNNNNSNTNTNSNVSYSSNTEIKEDTTITSGNYESSNADENALSVSGKITANISNISVTKTGDSDGGDNTSFYGTNSAILAKSGVVLNLNNINVSTNGAGANGVFSYGGSATTSNASSDNTTINISDSKITTTKDNSGGIMTTGGGIMNATNLEINTAGTSSTAIRSDRGGGTVTVDGGTYKTTGQGSPTIYSTADITVKNANLIATSSEGIVIEGNNAVSIENVTLTDTNNKLNGQSTTYKNLFLYQSMSGDADTGNSSFTATNSTIITNKGDTFYITNTTASINLTNNTFTNNDNNGNFLRIQKDSWGTEGANGGDVTLTMTNQKATGNIVVDSISTLTMSMSDNSYYEGAINNDNSAKSITLTLDKTSKIKLTKDSYVTKFNDNDSSYSNIDFNGYKLYVNNVAIN